MNDCHDGSHPQVKGLWIDYKIRVSTYDTDFAGHVSNIAYLRWLEDMRMSLFDKYFPLEDFLKEGKSPVIASTHIEYKKPVKLFDAPYGVMWISRMGNASLIMEAELYTARAITTTARHVGVFIELSTGRPVRLPPVCLELYKQAGELVPLLR